MKSLYLRIYLTLVVLLLAFAFGSTWLFQQHMEQERGNFELAANERWMAMAELIHRVMPPADAPRAEQAVALLEWAQRLRLAIALNDAQGVRIAASNQFERREDQTADNVVLLPLADGRSLSVIRGFRMAPPGLSAEGPGRPGQDGERARSLRRDESPWGLSFLGPRPNGQALVALLVLLFFGVAIGAFPVIRKLTRRLEQLRRGVEQFGAGNLAHRVDDEGKDEVAAVASSFNRAAAQIETLLRSQQSLLANASHELRSPLARLKLAFAMLDGAGPVQRVRLAAEINTNIAELDSLVEEVLLASRLDSASQSADREAVDLIGMAAEEAARVGSDFEPAEGLIQLKVLGEDRLLRRALRNLLENARRYGGAQVLLELSLQQGCAELRVCDRGPGVPPEMRERIFEAFFRLPGHAEQAGGVGLGLSLVKQIAKAHGGQVRCEPRPGGGSIFVLSLPSV
jgi:two-component system sensor histidine kinase RstB